MGMRGMNRSSRDKPIRVIQESPNLRELTTQAIRNAILNMHFKPKERLVERRLCEQTGVSRTSVREALRVLESEGLVERIPNRGLFVATVSRDEARQIYEVRAALESAAGERFVERADNQQLEALEAAFAKVQRTIGKQPVIAYVRALDEFYDVLLQGAGNEVARRVLKTLHARMSYLRAMTAQAADETRKTTTIARMREIVDAAVSRDAQLAASRCRDFVQRSAEFALDVLPADEEMRDEV